MMGPEQQHWQLFRLVSGIYLKSRRLAEKSLKPLGMTFPQFGALFNLTMEDNITQRQLATRLETDTTTAMVLCNSLEKKGWLKRVKDPSDKRVNRLQLTSEGRGVIAQALPLMESRYSDFMGVVSTEKMIDVLPVLEQFYEYISEAYREEIR